MQTVCICQHAGDSTTLGWVPDWLHLPGLVKWQPSRSKPSASRPTLTGFCCRSDTRPTHLLILVCQDGCRIPVELEIELPTSCRLGCSSSLQAATGCKHEEQQGLHVSRVTHAQAPPACCKHTAKAASRTRGSRNDLHVNTVLNRLETYIADELKDPPFQAHRLHSCLVCF